MKFFLFPISRKFSKPQSWKFFLSPTFEKLSKSHNWNFFYFQYWGNPDGTLGSHRDLRQWDPSGNPGGWDFFNFDIYKKVFAGPFTSIHFYPSQTTNCTNRIFRLPKLQHGKFFKVKLDLKDFSRKMGGYTAVFSTQYSFSWVLRATFFCAKILA